MAKPKRSKRAGASESKLSESVVKNKVAKIFENFVQQIPDKGNETTNGHR